MAMFDRKQFTVNNALTKLTGRHLVSIELILGT